jgi:hypothetical protein
MSVVRGRGRPDVAARITCYGGLAMNAWCRGGELNSLRRPFQGRALPVSYPGISVDRRLYEGLRHDARGVLEVGGWKSEPAKFAVIPRAGFARGICFFFGVRQSRSLASLGMTVGMALPEESAFFPGCGKADPSLRSG